MINEMKPATPNSGFAIEFVRFEALDGSPHPAFVGSLPAGSVAQHLQSTGPSPLEVPSA